MEPSSSRTRSFPQLRTSDKIITAQGALDALDDQPEIVAALAPRRYTAGEKNAEGRALLAAVRTEMDDQDDAAGDRRAATAGQMDALRGAQDLYRPLVETARVVFADDPDVLASMGLTGRHLKSYAARLERMRRLVGEARKPERLARIAADTEITGADLDALDAEIDAAETQMTQQDAGAALAQQATDERTDAVKALDKWMLTMQGHARVRLRGKRQLLEMLGVPRR